MSVAPTPPTTHVLTAVQYTYKPPSAPRTDTLDFSGNNYLTEDDKKLLQAVYAAGHDIMPLHLELATLRQNPRTADTVLTPMLLRSWAAKYQSYPGNSDYADAAGKVLSAAAEILTALNTAKSTPQPQVDVRA